MDFGSLFESMERDVKFICVVKNKKDKSIIKDKKQVRFNSLVLAANSEMFKKIFKEEVNHFKHKGTFPNLFSIVGL